MIPLTAGLTVWNPAGKGAGSLGIIARDAAGAPGLYLVSCYHVLFRLLNPGDATPPWVAPGAAEEILADGAELTLTGADEPVPIELPIADLRPDRPGSRDLDCAAALIRPGLTLRPGIPGLGAGPADDPAVGMDVRMWGAATGPVAGVSRGVVSLYNPATGAVEISAPQGNLGYRPARVGDSGSIWVDAQNLRPVAMHQGSLDFPPYTCRARAIVQILTSLNLAVWDGT